MPLDPKTVFRPFKILGATTLTLALLAGTALAQVATPEDTEVYVVVGDTLVLQELVVSASSVSTSTRDAPASISVVSNQDLAKHGSTDITQALRTSPGVNVGYGSNGTKGISLRGLGSSYTLILIDGKRVAGANSFLRHYNGDLDWLPVEAIERIEVVRGPMSTLYGSDAMGGVVNIITKKDRQAVSGSVTAEVVMPTDGITGGARKLSGYVSAPLIDNTLAFTGFGSISSTSPDNDTLAGVDGKRGVDSYDLTGRLTFTPDANHVIDAELSLGKQDYVEFVDVGGVPTTNPTEVQRIAGSLRHVGDWGFGTSTITGMTEYTENKGAQSITFQGSELDGKLVIPFDLIWPQHLTVGGSLRHERLEDPVNLGKPSPLNPNASPVAELLSGAVFAESNISLTDSLALTTGLRLDQHEKFGSHLSPRAYLVYSLTDDLTIKGGWSQGFKAPGLRELDVGFLAPSGGRGCGGITGPGGCLMAGNPDLQPETSDSWEIGANFERDGWAANLTYFYNEIDNKIIIGELLGYEPSGRPIVGRMNVQQARTSGIEGGLTVPLMEDLSWTSSFTYLFEAVNVSTGLPLAAEPAMSFHTSIDWQATEQLSLSASLDYFSEQVSKASGPTGFVASVVEPYALVNASLAYDVNDNLTLRGGVNNIFDTQPSTDSFFREAGRSVFVSATAKF
ncbi:TonB-dependent receptor [Devosia sp. 2618]|uniref:TonB-dependent receptor domain-containing protein n=1 Tax=Devosia sp. 2618 TaxID=3156454 RepID=UPI003392686D